MTNISFFVACFRLHWPRMAKRLALFVAMALILLLLGLAMAAAFNIMLAGDGFAPFTLAIADDSGDPALAAIISYLGETDGIRAYARMVSTDSLGARSMVAEGRAAAALVFPDGFLASVDTGENLTPSLILDLTRPLEALGVSLLAESAASMLSNAQKGIYLADSLYNDFDPVKPGAVDYDQMIWGINIRYINWVVDRGDLYQTRLIMPTGGEMTFSRHYLISALTFFIFLAPAGALYPVFSWEEDRPWLRRLRGADKPLYAYALAQVLWGAIAVFTLTLLLHAGAAAVNGLFTSRLFLPSLRGALPGMMLGAVFVSAFAFICSKTGHVISAVSLHFLFAVVFMALSGGVVPLALLPRGMRALSPYSPFTWMRDLVAPLYSGAGPSRGGPSASLISLSLAALASIVIVKVYCAVFDRCGREGV